MVSLRTIMVLVSVLFNLLMYYNECTMKLMYYNECTMKFKVYWKLNLLAIFYLIGSNQFFFHILNGYVILLKVVPCPLPSCLSFKEL